MEDEEDDLWLGETEIMDDTDEDPGLKNQLTPQPQGEVKDSRPQETWWKQN